MSKVNRIIDANMNRAREAMRVMEEAARFVLNDKKLSMGLKALRHDLKSAGQLLPHQTLTMTARNTPGDVGTTNSTRAEAHRDGVNDVVCAAGKRLSEALRVLEEYGKILSPDFATAIEQLRYRAYTLEQSLITKLPSGQRRQWRVCVILSENLCTEMNWQDVAKAALDAGAECIQLREKDIAGGELLNRASWLVELTRSYVKKKIKPAVIINDRPDIALLAGADGVHLGQDDLPIERVRQMVGSQMLIGLSTHNLKEASAAAKSGADYVGVGAIYPTTTKVRKASGITYLQKFISKFSDMHHLAIGGIHPDNIAEVAGAGAKGIAVSSVVCSSKQPGKVVRAFLKAMK